MKAHSRRAIVLIAGSIITQKQVSSVYDFSELKYFSFGGNANSTTVNVYEYKEQCYISGNGQDGNLSLYHHGNSMQINLIIRGFSFEGYDYDTNQHYSGKVNGSAISLYDYEHCQHFKYAI